MNISIVSRCIDISESTLAKYSSTTTMSDVVRKSIAGTSLQAILNFLKLFKADDIKEVSWTKTSWNHKRLRLRKKNQT